MVKFVGVLSLILLPLAACGGASESPRLEACQPRTVTFEAATDGSTGMTPVLPDGDEAVVAAVADSFCSPEWTYVAPGGTEQTEPARTVLPSDEAACIGDGLVEVLGAARATELKLGAGPWSLLFLGFNNFGERQIKRARSRIDCRCPRGMLRSMETAADLERDRRSRQDQRQLRDLCRRPAHRRRSEMMLVSEIDRAYDDPSQPEAQPFPETIEPLLAAYEECLSPNERRQVKF